ncbi:MAG: DinB family protein [Terracidiphilus sp.]
MPVPAIIAAAAGEFHRNTSLLEKVVAGIPADQWLSRPSDHSNHIAWIAGHMLWTRQVLMDRLGTKWDHPGLEVFARSAKVEDGAAFLAPEALLKAWREASVELENMLENVTEQALAAPAPPGPPSQDGKVSGFIGILAWHETYHLGQLAYLRGWLGYPGIFG